MVDPKSHAKEVLESQLGRMERALARKGVKKLPDELHADETILCIGVGEIPRTGTQHLRQNAEFAVLAATDERFLVISRLRTDEIPYEAIASVAVSKILMGEMLTVTRSDAEEIEFKGVTPAPGRANALAATIDQRRGVQSPMTEASPGQAQVVVSQDALEALVVGRVGGKVLDEIRKSCRPGEWPEFIVGEGSAGGLVAFSDRCMIIKKGALAGLMAGSVGGGRVATFMYSEITGLEYNSGWVNGVLEVLTPSYQGSANKDFWRGTFQARNADANDPWTLSNTLPLSKATYEMARPQLDHLRHLIADAKRPIIQAPAAPSNTNLSTEITRLAELHTSGVLDADEFRQAKQALLRRNAGS